MITRLKREAEIEYYNTIDRRLFGPNHQVYGMPQITEVAFWFIQNFADGAKDQL
jgi:hypothetical protein